MDTKHYLRLRYCAIISNVVMWMAAGMVYGQTTAPPNEVHHDSIYVSLPVFISSIIATAVFTWTIAKYDSNRIRKMEELENKLVEMGERMDKADERRHTRG